MLVSVSWCSARYKLPPRISGSPSRGEAQMKNAVTINEMSVLLVKAVKQLSAADRKRLGELLMEGLKTPIGGLKKKS